ncbi:hypothetical protein [Thiocapsa sp.]|uniref:hypothetical protein n=1 Tax=Thiocapsa sp. TaxID=2024551 RepID=UPI0035935BD3
MKTFILALIFLLVGSAIGGFLALFYGYGLGAAQGLMVGSQAGVCVALEAAEEKGLVTGPAQRDGLIATGVAKIREKSGAVTMQTGLQWISTADQCRDIIRQLEQGPDTIAPTPITPKQE